MSDNNNYSDNTDDNDNDTTVEYSEPTYENYVIPKGTNLYHSSFKQGEFNPREIRLTEENTLVAFFSSSKNLALDYIMHCKLKPEENAFIHKFRTKTDIDRIKIISINDLRKGQKDLSFIQDTFCNPSTEPFRQKYNGVGFFYNSSNLKSNTNNNETNNEIKINNKKIISKNNIKAEFALCDPNILEYINTTRCVNSGLSNAYRFDIKN